MEVEIEFETKNLDPIRLVFIGEAEYSSCNSDCGYNDGDVLDVNGAFYYASNDRPVGSLVSKYLWSEWLDYLIDYAGDM
jgi:hypothetical protein